MSEFSDLLRGLREERGFSLARLARTTNYSKGYLSKIENGMRPPSIDIARACDAALGTEGVLVAAVQPRFQSEIDRPEYLSYLDSVNSLLPVAPSLNVVGDLEFQTAQLWQVFDTVRAMGHMASPTLVYPLIMSNANLIDGLIREVNPAGAGELLWMAARFREYAGWMAQEAGQDASARLLTTSAAGLASSAGRPDLTQFALVRAADMALYERDGHAVIDLSRQVLDSSDASLSTRSIAWQRQAQGHALLGELSGCLRALDEAQRFHERACDRGEAGTLGTTSLSSPVEMTRGWAMVDLCRYEEAAQILRGVVADLPVRSVRSRVRFTVRLALAYALDGDLDKTCQVIYPILPDIRRVDSHTVNVDLKLLRMVLNRRGSGNASVADLRAEISSILRRSTGLP